jgi:hypothetical protein
LVGDNRTLALGAQLVDMKLGTSLVMVLVIGPALAAQDANPLTVHSKIANAPSVIFAPIS